MEIKIANKEETGRTIYTAVTVSVKAGKENHELETVFTQEYLANLDDYRYDVGEFDWISPEPEDSKRLKIEKAAKEHILSQFTKGKKT